MRTTLLSSWPLFFGLAMIMIGNGLQGTLLGVRATIEDFSTITTGVIMSLYYAGFLAGSWLVPKLIQEVGHIRVFAALASLASTTVLLHGIFPDPVIWGGVRIFTGFSYAGLYIVIESWLNQAATNKNRGQMLAIYMIVLYAGMALGQFLLNIASPEGVELFVLTSVLVSLALLPISLSSRPAPAFEAPETVSVKKLYKSSPLGLFGVAITGFSASALFSIAAVHMASIGMSIGQISTFMAVFILGGVLFQVPVGWCSDNFDRRKVLIIVSGLSSFFCLCALISENNNFYLLLLSALFLGGTSLSIYALALAHTNDHLQSSQIIAASATMTLVSGLASVFGPLAVTAMMGLFGQNMFFIFLTCVYATVVVFGLVRMRVRDAVPLEDQGDHVAMYQRSSPIVMQIAEESSETLKQMKD